MKYVVVSIAGWCCLTCLLYAGEETPGQRLSPYALVGGKGKVLYVATATSKKLVVFDPTAEKGVGEIPLPCLPSGMVLSPDALWLYVTAASPSGEVYAVDTTTQRVNLLAKGIRPVHPC